MRISRIGIVLAIILPVAIFSGYPASAKTRKQSDAILWPYLNETYGRLPLNFEINQGQTDSRVKFISRGSGYTLFLTANEIVLAFTRSPEPPSSRKSTSTVQKQDDYQSGRTARGALQLKLQEANLAPQVAGLEKLSGKVNYFCGNDPNRWHTDIPIYKKVKYEAIYPGINLIYYGSQRRLEYDFIVMPGADPKQISLAIEGASKIGLDSEGNLILCMGNAEIILHLPVVYQEKDGERKIIPGAYTFQGKNRIGFEIAAYDTDKPLIIDPVLSYSTFLGGTQSEMGRGLAVDASGRAYVTGMTPSSDFPFTTGAYDVSYNGNSDVFVTKLNSNGSALVYSTYLGGTDYEWAHAVVLDSGNNAYITGYTHSSNFPTTSGAYDREKGGGASNIEDVFVAKLNSSGNMLVYSTFLGGDQSDWGEGIAVDSEGNAYITGITWSSVFPTTENAYEDVYNGNGDVFVSKFDATGASLLYSTYLGGALTEYGFDIAVDTGGNAYITGQTSSNPFPTTTGAFQTTHKGGTLEAFITKINATGTDLVYSTYLGGSGWDFGHGIMLDNMGNAYVTGGAASFDFPTKDAFQSTNKGPIQAFPGGGDAFVVRLNAAGSALLYSTFLGGIHADEGHSIALDTAGNIYVAGLTFSYDFPIANAVQEQLCQGCTNVNSADAFLTKLNPGGSGLVYSTYLGGIQYDWAHAVAVDKSGAAYIVGDTSSEDFPVTSGAYQEILRLTDAFVAKIGEDSFPWELFYPAFIKRRAP